MKATFPGGTVLFQTSAASARVTDSNGMGISDAVVKYKGSNSHWHTLGKTNKAGIAVRQLFAGTYDLYATYSNTQSGILQAVFPGDQVIFQTSATIAQVIDKKGAGVSGITVKFKASDGEWRTLAKTGKTGVAAKELFAGTYDFYAAQKNVPTALVQATVPGSTIMLLPGSTPGDAPQMVQNTAPVLQAIADQSVVEDGTATVAIAGSDANGDKLTFSAQGLPAFASLREDSPTTASIQMAPGRGDAGSYLVTVSLSDGQASTSQEFEIAVLPQPYQVSWDSHNTPATIQAGERYAVDIILTNIGSLNWSSTEANPTNLSYHWYRGACISSNLDTWDGDRTPLPADVTPGARVNLTASLTAPSMAGTYCLVWDIVQEQVVWFSWVSSNMLVVPVQAES